MKREMQGKECGALKGVKIVDLSTVLAGPYASQLLVELGADVVKLEALEGDIMRAAGAKKNDRMGHIYLHANKRKRSIAVNLKMEEGIQICHELIEKADVFMCNQRPEAMRKLKLNYEHVKKIKPEIIYATVLGFGTKSSYYGQPAYDDLIQGYAGVPWLMMEAGNKDPQFMPGAFVDRITGLHLALAITSAIVYKQRTGEGQKVEVPMYESMLSIVLGEHMGGLTFIPQKGKVGYRRTLSKYRKPYRAKDGYINVLIYTDKQWMAFFDIIGQSEKYRMDRRFSTATARSDNVDAVYAWLEEQIGKKSVEEWLRCLREAEIPAGEVRSIQDIVTEESTRRSGFVREVYHPSEGRIMSLDTPFEMSRTPASGDGYAAQIGEHTNQLLHEIGYSEETIKILKKTNTIG